MRISIIFNDKVAKKNSNCTQVFNLTKRISLLVKYDDFMAKVKKY